VNTVRPAKPVEVRQGVVALWIALGINLVNGVMHALIHFSRQGQIVAALEATAVLLLAWFFLYHLARGRNWARITYLIMKVLSIGGVVDATEVWWQVTPLYVAINWISLIATFYGAYLLFTYPSDRWFEAMSVKVRVAQE
jgi:crotonobetainyl-CoA:carnitine CoA-transferase CaiB-like acyl-CoA transferase